MRRRVSVQSVGIVDEIQERVPIASDLVRSFKDDHEFPNTLADPERLNLIPSLEVKDREIGVVPSKS